MRCTVCHHPQRQEIDRALAAGVSVKVLSLRHGLSRSALTRHRRNHVREITGTRPGCRSYTAISSRRLRKTHIPGKTDRCRDRLLPLVQIIEETQELLEQLVIWWEAQGHSDFPISSGRGSRPDRGRGVGDADAVEQERLAVGL